MSSKKKSNRREKHRTSTRPLTGAPPQHSPEGDLEQLPQLDLLTGINDALRDPHPLALLASASSLMAALDPRVQSSIAGESDLERPTLSDLCETFIEAGFRQTDALLKVIAEMWGDDLLRERVRRAVAERRHAVPGWVLRLDQVRPYRAVEMTHVLRDGDNIVLGVQLPGKRELSIVVYIDHNMGTVVKDAFVLDMPIEEVILAWAGADSSADTEINDIPLADARARITPAIDYGAITFPPFETDTWPASRPLAEWIVSMLPDGGSGYERPEWSEKQLVELTDDFFASEFGRPINDDDHRDLLGSILWFGTDYGPGDPLRWSPVAVEIMLNDWMPRKLVAPVDYLSKVPTLLRAFVRYSHAVRAISPGLTEETLAAVEKWEPEYQQAIRTPHHHGALALLERMGALDGLKGIDPDWATGLIDEEYMLGTLARTVGGMDALDRLSTEPLPDEPIDWTGIPDDIVGKVTEVGDLVDGCSDVLFDVEFRTASRRFLAWVAAGDPDIFRRKSAAKAAAAAICWVIGKANESFADYHRPGPQVKQLMAHFGLRGTASQRAQPMLRAVGVDWQYGDTNLGDPRLLVSDQRARVVKARDQYRTGD